MVTGLGLAVAVFTVSTVGSCERSAGLTCQFLSSYSMVLAGIRASFSLFTQAWEGVMRSPTRWHDRTPVSVCLLTLISSAG